MSKFTNEQIEVISISALNILLCSYPEIGTKINWNDKEPSWDGHVYLYEDKTHKKSRLEGRVPVQVKGTEVKRFGRKFASFPMLYSDIKNYYYDGGVLFFVIQIVSNTEFRVFYKFLLPIDLKKIMEEITEKGQKGKSVHIDKILNDKCEFSKELSEFLMHKQRQSVSTVERAVSLEDLSGKSIEFIGDKNPLKMMNKDIYFYTRDEFGAHIPVKDIARFNAFSYKVDRDFIIGSKKYFDNFQIVNYEGEEIRIIGDGIEYNVDKGKINLTHSTMDISTRLKTLEFFEKLINPSKKEKLKKELGLIDNQKKLIYRLNDVCETFNIPKKSIKLSEMTVNDEETLRILENIKPFEDCIEDEKEEYTPSIIRVEFFDKKILLLCIESENHKYFSNYYEEKESLGLIGNFNNTKVSIGRFSILKDIDLLTFNFNIEIVKKSINDIIEKCKPEDKKILSDQYNLLALESVKAWDACKKNDYLELAKYIFDKIESFIDADILNINKAQIEKREFGEISKKTEEDLYKIKLQKSSKDEDYNEVIAAIDIILENEESFKIHFEKVLNKKIFMDYPIYTLYSKINN